MLRPNSPPPSQRPLVAEGAATEVLQAPQRSGLPAMGRALMRAALTSQSKRRTSSARQRPLEHPPNTKVSVRDQRGRAAAGLLETGRSTRDGGSAQAGSLARAVVGRLLIQEPLEVELGVVVERRKGHRGAGCEVCWAVGWLMVGNVARWRLSAGRRGAQGLGYESGS